MIIVDVETSGLNPLKHSILSIGAVDFFNPSNQFYGECKIPEGAEIDEKALEINGFSQEEIINPEKMELNELISDFFVWAEKIKPKILSGHNIHFDVSFLKSAFYKSGLPWVFGHRTVDLHSEGFTHHLKTGREIPIKDDRPNITSDFIHNYVGLPEEPKPHNALIGAKMEAESFSRLIHGKNLFNEFEIYPIPEFLTKFHKD
ncbi:MAG: 3'-5' exonuclease [Candidatus Pacearchaeota archaeon]